MPTAESPDAAEKEARIFEKFLKDPLEDVRKKAVYNLGQLGRVSSIPKLIEALHDPSFHVRSRAVEVLGGFGQPHVIPHLVRALDDEHIITRTFAAKALGRIGRSIQDKPVRSKEAKALKLVGQYFHEQEQPHTVVDAFQAALNGKITTVNARLYVKQLRALKGSLK